MSVALFEQQRPRLTAIAYGMLGSLADAEDVVQDAWLRWADTDLTAVREPAAFLTTVVTRLAIDRLRSARHRRETYTGPWLPEPIVTELDADPAEVVAEAEALSLALLTALERLNPVERAVLLLRDVFDLDYAEIADVVDRSPSAVRQIAVRARDRAGDHARTARVVDRDRDREVVEAFMVAAASGDLDRLVELLTEDVVAWGDGGGKRAAARHPVAGADRVARFIAGITRQGLRLGGTGRLVRANGRLAFRAELDGEVYAVLGFDVEDGRISAIRSVVNPDKLTHA